MQSPNEKVKITNKRAFPFYRKYCFDPTTKTLIEFGGLGHFPLFFKEWIHEAAKKQESFQPNKAKSIHHLKKLARYPSLQKKREYLLSLKSEERVFFINFFFHVVEERLLDHGTRFH